MVGPAEFSSEIPDPRRFGSTLDATLRICALLPEVETAISTLQSAVAAAQGFPAAILAVHVGFDPRHANVSAEEVDIQQLRDLHEGAPKLRIARIKAAFDDFVSRRTDSPPIQWKDDEGDIGASIVGEAQAADLLVIARPVHLDASDAMHSALFDVRRLALVAPHKALEPGAPIGRHIIVGWKPGDAVRRAISAALPWLRRAKKVSVLWVAKQGAEPYEASAREFFAKLGTEAEIVALSRNHQSVGAQLLAEAMRRGGDCLLIGAFRHGSLWDAVLGGVTRDVLGHAEIPVFLMR
jgi:nucleotide-binding universal stress UspA family protein